MQLKPVLVTTEYRGVFFGYLDTSIPIENRTVKLEKARNCLYWPAECKGFIGLAKYGPLEGSRVGPPVTLTLYGVTCIAECEPAAVDRWEKFAWK